MSTLTNLDPTGTLSAAASAVGLVTAVLRFAPALKNASNSLGSGNAASNAAGAPLQHTNSVGSTIVGKDPERERRAYETVNYVLREFGNRVCAAGLVDEHALTRALTAATKHIEVNLFSGEANRLFESLTAKLADPLLVNSVFTSIYLFGALAAELSSSLPNYKDTYMPVDRMLVHQLFLAAIGDGAFRENRSANLDAYQTLAYTAGLLRPTDIGYSTFPGFPSLQPSSYSSKSFGDVRNNKSVYEKLVKHFDRYGFPQPTLQRQAQVGAIRDWRFLHGESNSKSFDVERADKNIGENFGRVLHWLVCSADRMPLGQAVIAYYGQHIELIKWIGGRMGFVILAPAVDLIMTGNHAAMDTRLRATLNNWVILMSCEQAKLARQASINKWVEDRERAAQQIRKMQASQNATSQAQNAANIQRKPSVASSPPPSAQQPYQSTTRPPNTTSPPAPQQPYQPSMRPHHTTSPPPVTSQPSQAPVMPPSTMATPQPVQASVVEQFNTINNWFNARLKPQCQALLNAPPADRRAFDAERARLIHLAEQEVVQKLDALEIPEGTQGREKRKAVIMQAQSMISALETVGAPLATPVSSSPSRPAFVPLPSAEIDRPLAPSVQTASVSVQPPAAGGIADAKLPLVSSAADISSPPSASTVTSPTTSPPPYSPGTSPAGSTSTTTSGFPFHEKRNTVVRRRAPPPPRTARALYDFEPDEEEDNDDELAFKEGDVLEITAKSADLEAEGWCKARIKGTRKVGLAPLEYLEMIAPVPQPSSLTSALNASAGPSQPASASISKPPGPSQSPIGTAPHMTSGPQHPQNVQHSSLEANISFQNQPSMMSSVTNPSKPPITHTTSNHSYAPTYNYAPATSNVSGSAAEYYQISSGAPAKPPAAAINTSTFTNSSQTAASAQSMQGSSAAGPSTQNTNPLTNPNHTGPVEVKNKVGKLEKAGLGLAAVGAAAGVANVIQDAQQPSETHTQTQTVHKQQQPDTDQNGGNGNSQNQAQSSNEGDPSSSNTQNNAGGADQSNEHQGQTFNNDSNDSTQTTQPPNSDPDQNTTDQPSQFSTTQSQDPSSQNNADNASSSNNGPLDANNDDTYTTTTNTTNTNNTYFTDPLLPPATDLSAFGGGFEPYTDSTTPLVAPITSTGDPYYDPAFVSTSSDFISAPVVGDETLASFDAPATTSPFAASPFAAAGVPVDDDATGLMSSPFASMAAPSSSSMGGYQEVVEESTVVVSSQQDLDGGTSWEATEVVDDFSF